VTLPEGRFRIRMSERCWRFAPDTLPAHAPKRPGVYELIDANKGSEVLYVGLACPETLYARLAAHAMGKIRPTFDELVRARGEVFFDYVAEPADAAPEDLRDIAGALMIQHNPPYNLRDNPPASGRFGRVLVEETP
jgi:excinuclease UvrABC nuclease subunit